jgi:signal transduction histidine kinase
MRFKGMVMRNMTEEALRACQLKLHALPQQHEALLQQERRRIAVHLHDELGQLVNIAKFKLAAVMEDVAGSPLEPKLAAISDLVDRMNHQIRSLEYELSPPVLRHLGLVSALAWLAENLHDTYGLSVELVDDGEDKPLDQSARSIVFRAVRELLVNVAKHAQVYSARVETCRQDNFLVVTVCDNGIGFETKQALQLKHPGLGLQSVLEQLAYLGGAAKIHSVPGEGCVATLRLPLETNHIERRKAAWLSV